MNVLTKLGWIAGVIGALLCVVGIVSRLVGVFWIGVFQAGTLMQAGTTAMVFGCFCLLAVLVQK